MKRAIRKQRGFTLVELMVAMALGLMLTAVIITVFSQSSRTGTVTQAGNEIQEQARVALEMLQRDMRQAGYIGCNSNRLEGSGRLVNAVSGPTGYYNNLDQFLLGHEGTGAAFTPAAPPEITAAVPAASPISDAVTVRVTIGQPVSLSGTMGNGTAPIPVFSTAGFPVGTRAVVGDCAQSSAFMVTGVTGGLQHDGAANAIGDFGRAYGPDAMVVPFETISYYVALNVLSGERSLWRRVGAAASEEVAEGVEDFQVTYGQDTNIPADQTADIFTEADDVADWDQVVSVRASLLVRSKADNVAQGTQDYNFNGATNVAPPDRRLRRPFNVTIQLRNRTI